jgi:hypothetical protein
MTMNESNKKLITEKLLGECWQVFNAQEVSDLYNPCPACGVLLGIHRYRTFTTWDDFGACFNRLVELGKLGKFYAWAECRYFTARPSVSQLSFFLQWLLSRTESGHYRLCCLIAEWLKEGNV